MSSANSGPTSPRTYCTAIHEWLSGPELHHALRFKRTIRDQLRVHPSKAFRDVAIPANRLMRREDVGKLLGAHLLPFRRFKIGSEQSRGVIHVMKFDRLVAKDAILPVVPFRDDIPEQAILRIDLNLLEAILTAALPLGPARALDEAQGRLVEKSADGGFSRCDVDGRGPVRLRAGDQAFPFEAGIGAHAGCGSQYEQANCQHEYGNDDGENGGRHRTPPRMRSRRRTEPDEI